LVVIPSAGLRSGDVDIAAAADQDRHVICDDEKAGHLHGARGALVQYGKWVLEGNLALQKCVASIGGSIQ
jgi:hypothetical protein